MHFLLTLVKENEMRMPLLITGFAAVVAASCASFDQHRFIPGSDAAAYLRAHPEVPASVAAAMQAGHAAVGMTAEQVRATVGQPVYSTVFQRDHVELWLIPAARFHGEHFRYHNPALFRIAFRDGFVIAIDPIQ